MPGKVAEPSAARRQQGSQFADDIHPSKTVISPVLSLLFENPMETMHRVETMTVSASPVITGCMDGQGGETPAESTRVSFLVYSSGRVTSLSEGVCGTEF